MGRPGSPDGVREGPVGIACNPASGKDVRRLTARASVFDNQEKHAIVRRAIVGAVAAGAREFRYVPDTHEIASSAFAEFEGELVAKPVDAPLTGSALDTVRGAAALEAAGCAAVITLGGDGTNRAFTRGWPDAPLLPVSTGTNNVFPRVVEATVAGSAAGAVATGRVALGEVARRAKRIAVEIDGESDDLALIDAVLTSDRFIGSRALTQADRLQAALVTRADPAGIGITSIGGLLHPVRDDEDVALWLELGEGGDPVAAPIAPGHFQEVPVRSRAHRAVRRDDPGRRQRHARVRRRERACVAARAEGAFPDSAGRSVGDRCGAGDGARRRSGLVPVADPHCRTLVGPERRRECRRRSI